MPQAEAAALEFRRRPPPAFLRGRLEERLRREHALDLLGIVRPVGSSVAVSAARELARSERGEIRLHEPALVVALLRPGIGKEKMDAGKRCVSNHALEHLYRVVADDAQVRELRCIDLL